VNKKNHTLNVKMAIIVHSLMKFALFFKRNNTFFKVFLFVIMIVLNNIPLKATENYIIGYYRSWHREYYLHNAIPYKNLTHIAHAFIWPHEDGSLEMNNNFLYPELVQTAHQNGTKIVVSIGGWGKDKGFSPMAADAGARKNFTANLVQFCKKHGYDGADLDWEYPHLKDKENLCLLVKELSLAFKENNLSCLAAALPAKDWNNGYDIAELNRYFSWYGIMTYDFHGSWSDHVGHNAPFLSPPGDPCKALSVKDCADYWINEKGMFRDKLCVGLPFYGRVFEASALHQKMEKGGDAVSYADAMKRLSRGWKYQWDSLAGVPFLVDDNQTRLLSFDDTRSIENKCAFVREQNLKGVIIWALGHDDTGTSQPLLSVAAKELFSKGNSGLSYQNHSPVDKSK